MKGKVLVSVPAAASGLGELEALADAGLDIVVHPCFPSTAPEQLIEFLSNSVAVVAGREPYPSVVFDRVPTLRHVARAGIGYDGVDVAAATVHGVLITVTPGTSSAAVADHAWALILSLAHGVPRYDREVRAGQWDQRRSADVFGATLGIIGFGRIGQAVARRAEGFDMRVMAYDPVVNVGSLSAHRVEPVPIETLLQESDFVTLHLPLTRETHHFIDASKLRLMRSTAFLVNTARGDLVDEDALHTALSHGMIAGAGLDVRSDEPPKDLWLASLENVVSTPHSAGNTRLSWRQTSGMAASAVLDVLHGRLPEGALNPEALARPSTTRSRTP